MRNKYKLLLTFPIIISPLVSVISCSNTTDSSNNGEWKPIIPTGNPDTRFEYNYETLKKSNSTNFDRASNTATIDLATMWEHSTSFPFVKGGFKKESLDPMFENMLDKNNPNYVPGRSGLFDILNASSAFPGILESSTYTYSLMSKFYDGSEGDLNNPGFYHSRPTNANGEIEGATTNDWNTLEKEFGLPNNGSDILTTVKSVFDKTNTKTRFPDATKVYFNTKTRITGANASPVGEATYYSTYFDEETTTYLPLPEDKVGFYYWQPVDENGKGMYKRGLGVSYVEATFNSLDSADFTYAAGQNSKIIRVEMPSLSKMATINQSIPATSANGATANFGVLAFDDPILVKNGQDKRINLMQQPIVISVPKNSKFSYNPAEKKFVNTINELQKFDLFSPDALEYVEPQLLASEIGDAKRFSPSVITVGGSNYSLSAYDKYAVIRDHYIRDTEYYYIKSSTSNNFPHSTNSVDDLGLGLTEDFIKLRKSNDLAFVRTNGGMGEIYASKNPVFSAATAIVTETRTPEFVKAIDKIETEKSLKIIAGSDTYVLYARSKDGNWLGEHTGFFLEQPATIQEAEDWSVWESKFPATVPMPTPVKGLNYSMFGWGQDYKMLGWKRNTLPDSVFSTAKAVGEFSSIQPVHISGGDISITPLPKPNETNTSFEAYQNAGFQLLPINSIISNRTFVNYTEMGFVPYLKDDKGTPTDNTDDVIYKKKLYFDLDENGNPITVTGAARDKYKLPQIMTGFYNEKAVVSFKDYKNALASGNIDDYLTNQLDYTKSVNSRFVVPNESQESRMYKGKIFKPLPLAPSIKMYYEAGFVKSTATRNSAIETYATMTKPLLKGQTITGVDIDIEDKYSNQVHFSGSMDNTPAEFMQLIGSEGQNLIDSSIASSIKINLNWGSEVLGSFNSFPRANLSNLISDLNKYQDEIYKSSSVINVPAGIYRMYSMKTIPIWNKDLTNILFKTKNEIDNIENNNGYIENTVDGGIPIVWWVANKIDSLVRTDGDSYVIPSWGGENE